MKETVKSRKRNEAIRKTQESIREMMSEEGFIPWLIELRDALSAKSQQSEAA